MKVVPGQSEKSKLPVVKPFLKWAGGKGQLLGKFQKFYPPELFDQKIRYYYEPFVGGGAVFFDIVQKFEIEKAFLFDVNEELVLVYKVIQNEVNLLIEQLKKYEKLYFQKNEANQKEFYYKIRHEFNHEKPNIDYQVFSNSWIERAAQIIFLNKTCFNGLFRFNSRGEFNVPAGKYKNPKILDESNLLGASNLLQRAEIFSADFRNIKNNLNNNAFVYFDPPYRPLNKTSSFTAYSKFGFGDKEQNDLSQLFTQLNKNGIKLMLSNSDPKNTDPGDNFFDDLYKDFNISRVPAKRMINSNASKRQAIQEIIVTNYPVIK